MLAAAQELLATVERIKSTVPLERQGEVKKILLHLDRYLKATYATEAIHKRGEALTSALDPALKVAILLLENIDQGTSGLDDETARMLKRHYERYLGPLIL